MTRNSADGGVQIPDGSQEWIEERIERCGFVEWDRFTRGEDPDDDKDGLVITVYGWIERPDDEYKDFVVAEFWTARDIVGFTTSSAQYSRRLHELLTGATPDEHEECHRVEHTFEIENAITTTKQVTLTDE
jgi:hypothetical protein